MRPGRDTGPRQRKGEAWRGITRLGRDPGFDRGTERRGYRAEGEALDLERRGVS